VEVRCPSEPPQLSCAGRIRAEGVVEELLDERDAAIRCLEKVVGLWREAWELCDV